MGLGPEWQQKLVDNLLQEDELKVEKQYQHNQIND
tara:strand:- start:205 stop:309 length:105 start_codon:yes stop_codon:yes gene_type:complete